MVLILFLGCVQHIQIELNLTNTPNTQQRKKTMQNSFIPDAIEIVSRAITADNDGEYDKALSLYRDALSRFTIGLKYEKNESKKVRHIIIANAFILSEE